MVEGGVSKASKTEFTECWNIVWTTPYIMKLALSAGIGGLLFGYDTGVISGALLYIKEDFRDVEKKTWLQEFGRKISLLGADVLFFIGAIIMAIAPQPWVIILGRIFVGLGVGMASMTAPLYISEASPAKIRGALAPGTWRWMLGVAGLPAVVQFGLMMMLPESPRWLYRQNKVDEARAILEKIYPADQVEEEVNLLKQSVENEKAEEGLIGKDMISRLKGAFGNKIQFVGINTVMYYSPTIVQFAGFASKSTALALSLVTSGLNALGSIVSMAFVDKYGRRRLMIVSMFGLSSCLVALAVSTDTLCSDEHRTYFISGCPSSFGWLAVVFLGAYIITYSPGMGTAPWIVNSEIYPLRYRGVGGGIAAVSNWTSNLIVSLTFLTLTEALGSAGTFLLFAGFSLLGLVAIYLLVPETKGLAFEEVEKMLETGFKPSAFMKKSNKSEMHA
ncbi:Inositol transporter 4 [Citrus sinensis]|uniref:Inositol transporter 4 n=1 Tax=Citrus sinensis TaxID=2711 RepID=A0ACB8NJW5_CITSI|nr:Inositol transporter 4 [Citrus sinensis]KAH9798162.1 Inositol transporter 4 [Citrus sinensis]